MSNFDETQFKEILNKLDLIVRLLALNIVKDLQIQKEKIIALSSFGFGPTDIAKLLGTTPNTVSVALSETKKKVKKEEKPTKTNQAESKPSQETDTAKVGETIA